MKVFKDKRLKDYQPLGVFAKTYLSKEGKPVRRSYIYKLRLKELSKPGSTPLEFIEVAGLLLVRRRPLTT